MRRNQRLATRRISRGSDLPRLASMLVSLLLIGMVIRYAANADNWRWVDQWDANHAWAEGDEPEVQAPAPAKPEPGKPAPAKPAPAKPGPAKPAPAKPDSAKPAVSVADQPSDSDGLTDLDPEEADSASEEFQAVGDRVLFTQPEEMLAYNRLVKWARNQTFEMMLKRAKRKVVFNDFVQSPDKWRGKLVALDLIARRVLKYDEKPDDNPLYENLYEMWGGSSESQSWLYEVVLVDPPKNLPTGPSLFEKVRVVGYFFKLQGYQPAGAKPNDPPLFAPAFIGRVLWNPPVIPRVQSADYLWAAMVAGLFGLIMVAALVAAFLSRRRKPRAPSVVVGTSGLTTDEWLDRAVTGDAPLDDNPPGEAPSRAEWPREEP